MSEKVPNRKFFTPTENPLEAIMRFTSTLAGLALSAVTQALCPYAEQALRDPEFMKRHLQSDNFNKETPKEKRQSGPGNIPFTTFNENQLIDVTGEHAWVAPGPGDIRGPCPGLNALANHGYFPHVCSTEFSYSLSFMLSADSVTF